MSCFSRRIAPALLEVYDFSTIGTLMDVAGGHGAVLCEILTRYPNMNGILFDMPNVIEEANCHICSLNMDQRCQTLSGDFFEQIPPGADAYYMQHILHDWNDERCLKILANCRSALQGRAGGRLLVVDSVVPENSDPHPANGSISKCCSCPEAANEPVPSGSAYFQSRLRDHAESSRSKPPSA